MKRLLTIPLIISVISLTACSNKIIAEDKAKQIAINDAGVNQTDITFTTQEKENDEFHYLFEDTNYTYEYKINIHDGTIENKEILVKEHSPINDYDKIISSEKAKAIGLAYFNFQEDEVTDLNIELDNDNINIYYKLKFHKGTHDYAVSIEAINGTLKDVKTELDE